ncbi:FAD linked oxidase domain-containing protein [Marinobacter santoriniensis NKSG1]|uniref:FAD linked oxidase domain-containing protein n=1 Tax=Marinobacter santoriniensis NKSG1 TaxID=1288826 RepID=M7CWZ4_9GAMM|nr:FAD-binding oxidoreductase [Marinobacter santoriniensis]EMP56760.1 FAD linked oxidase domain-containing protein [Marinobacter santoriniensis NKSG1]
MRRWNGWGDDQFTLDLPDGGIAFLEARIGSATPLPDATLEAVCQRVPESRLELTDPVREIVFTDAEIRVRHARGQSLPDWLAMRSGEMGPFPDGVALPEDAGQIRALLDYAREHRVTLIPYGGGTSVAGHINPLENSGPVLTLSLARMNRLVDLDQESQVATFGAGTPGPLVEAQLRARGYTLGHFPQSFELSTIGGWVASRSSGQQSLRYGRIEQLFAGGAIETLQGTLTIPTVPASSAGPDVREMILGSEGRLGILSEVKVRVSPLPEQEQFHVAFFPDWQSAREACRMLVQNRIQLSMLRLSNAVETQTQLALAGHPALIGMLERYLRLRGTADGKCMMTFGVTGSVAQCKAALRQARRLCKQFGGIQLGTRMGDKWAEKRFTMPYLREALWQEGYAVDTLETATDWSNVDSLMGKIETNLREGLGDPNQPTHVFTHLSHVYGEGCSIYTTYVFPVADSYAGTLKRWQTLKHSTSELIVANGGTISHQHGVGKDHAPYLPREKGPLGMAAIEALQQRFDPDGLLNPGTLVE